MALSEIDRRLLQRCLAGEARSWEEFVDRFMGLVLHVVDHTIAARGITMAPEDREDVVAEVFLEIVRGDFHVLRIFRGESSLATYLTVIARRVVVHDLAERASRIPLDRFRQSVPGSSAESGSPGHRPSGTTGHHTASTEAGGNGARVAQTGAHFEQRIQDQDEVERLLATLDGSEAAVVRLYHLEGKTYREISHATGLPENTVGPTLSRARSKLRAARVPPH